MRLIILITDIFLYLNSFDYETRHYTNLTGYFSLFGDRKLHLCGTNFYGYVQDVS